MSKVVEAMAEAAEVAIYGRHTRGFIVRPLIDAPDMKTDMKAALNALDAAGFVVVPKEPTDAMLLATGEGASGLKRRLWALMLAASRESTP